MGAKSVMRTQMRSGWVALVIAMLCWSGGPVAHAESPAAPPQQAPVGSPHPDLPFQYARITRSLPLSRTLADARVGRVSGWLTGGDTWVSLRQQAQVGGRTFYLTGYGWAPGDRLQLATPSTMTGGDLRGYGGLSLGRIFVPQIEVRATPDPASPVVATMKAYDLLAIQGQYVNKGERWYALSQDAWIPARGVRLMVPGTRPAGIGPNERWIEVNLREQMVFAHEGDTPVFAALAATGKTPRWPTVQGLFRIWLKAAVTRMDGGDGPADAYDLADVPWTMFFHQSYGLHAAYWHDSFGAERSHGCVNLSPTDAKWLFHWAGPALPEGQNSVQSSAQNPGTWVWVHD